MLEDLPVARSDSLMELARLMAADPRPGKLDLGVGTYRDAVGAVPIPQAVKAAEAIVLRDQVSKGYLGPVGDRQFAEALIATVLGGFEPQVAARMTSIQAPGGTGALRLALQLIAQARPQARVWIGVPTWPAHIPLIQACGLLVRPYDHLDASGKFNRAALDQALEAAAPGDVFLIHGCCHNPTGVDLDPDAWTAMVAGIAGKGLVPLVDLAYPGLGDGLAEDVVGARRILETCDNALVAMSCSKSFGLYRDRTGLLVMLGRDAAATSNLQAVAAAHGRLLWSNPPDHGAAVVRTILASGALTSLWRSELDGMRARVNGLRAQLAALPLQNLSLARLSAQRGMFAMLPLSVDEIVQVRERHGVYMDSSGRINVAGLNDANFAGFTQALMEIDGVRQAA